MIECAGLLEGAAVIVLAAFAAMWINDNFHLGGEFNDEAP
jgi:hypothetical protein